MPPAALLHGVPTLPRTPATAVAVTPAQSGSQSQGAQATGVQSLGPAAGVNVIGGLFMGEGLIPLPPKLVHKIVSLEFVEMAELMPEAWLFEEPAEEGVKIMGLPKHRKAPITDILCWLQCYGTMVAALATKFPGKVPQFMAYQSLIIKSHRDFAGLGWVQYDRAFRHQVAVTKDLEWSRVNSTLHSLCFAGKQRRSPLCSLRLSDNHPTKRCPDTLYGGCAQGAVGNLDVWAQMAWQGPPPPAVVRALPPEGKGTQLPWGPQQQLEVAGGNRQLFSARSLELCRLYNWASGPVCSFSPCKFLHACLLCGGPQPASRCKAAPGAQRLGKRPG